MCKSSSLTLPLLLDDTNVGPIEPEWDGCPVIPPCTRLPNCSPISCIGMAVNNNVLESPSPPPPLFDIMMTG